jgi:O-antigen ligase
MNNTPDPAPLAPAAPIAPFSLKPLVPVLFLILLATYNYNGIFRIGINLYWSDLIVMIIMFLTLSQWLGGLDLSKYRRYILPFVLLFLYYLLLVFYGYALLGNSINDVFGRFRNLFFYPLLFFPGFAFTVTPRDLQGYLKLIKIYVLISVGIGLLSLIYPAFNLAKIYARDDSGKVIAESLYFMIVGHGTALLCCLVFIHELLCLLNKTGKMARSLFFMVTAAIGIVGTQNRSIWVVFLLSFLLIFRYSRSTEKVLKRRRKAFALLVVLLTAGLFIFLIYSPAAGKFEKRLKETSDTFSGEREFFDTITGIRIGRTIAAFKEWEKTPLFGCGWGSQMREYHIYDLKGNYVRTNYGTPHNYYITILYQTGIIGFLMMIVIFYRIYRALKPREKLNRLNITSYSLFIFYLIFLVFNIGNTHLYSHPVFIPVNFFLLGAAVSYAQLSKEND